MVPPLRGIRCVALAMMIVLALMGASAMVSEDVEERISPGLPEVVTSDVWVFNDSLKSLTQPSFPPTYLCSTDDGTVEAWRKKSDVSLWSFSTGRPLVSFQWFSKEAAREEGEEAEGEEDLGDATVDEEWHVEVPEVPFEADSFFSVRNSYNESLKVTVDDLRHGTVLVKEGQLIQLNRLTTTFVVDAETGASLRELGSGNEGDLNIEERNRIYLTRTDYTARACNLSGMLLWNLSYGEFGTIRPGLQSQDKTRPSLALLPPKVTPSAGAAAGIPKHIVPPLTLPAVIVGKGQQRTTIPLDMASAPPSLPLPKPTLAIWEEYEPKYGSQMEPHAPGMLPPPKPTPRIVFVYTTAVGIVIVAIVSVVVWISVTSVAPRVPAGPPKKKKGRRGSLGVQEPYALNGGVFQVEDKFKDENGTQVGRLFVTDVHIGYGSHGTLVLEGYLDDRNVAVKRLLAVYYEKAQKEIALLIASDEHPNVVRYYAMERTKDFVYLALERCSFSLDDLILAQTSQGPGMEKRVKECLAGKGLKVRSVEDFKLWDDKGRPSAQLFKIMRDIVAGLVHLHEVGIVHRDLKPHNVLISSGRIMQAKIADMGLSKQLDDDAVSFDTHLTGLGTSGSRGWQAPEQLLRGRGSRAMDIFSLGSVLYYCITGGKHPFGLHLERDTNIVDGKKDLFHIVDFPEATDLIESLLDPDPAKRLPAQDILQHPFFWDAEKSLTFLKDASDRVELDLKDNTSVLFLDIESLEPLVLCGGWDGKLDAPLLQNIRSYRRYQYKSVRDLLRVIRNKANHFRELPVQLQEILGPVPDGLYEYFKSRFPNLLIDVYQVIGYHCRTEASFEKYYPASYVSKFPF